MSRSARRYAAYGLCIGSEISLPLPPASRERGTEVDIRIGAVPKTLTAPRVRRGAWEAAPGVFLMSVDGVARYLVRDGREITVQPARNGDQAVNAFLLGSVFAACLKQRGVLTVHASAIATADGAVLFAGHSGSGKSTLLAALLQRGHAMLCDDVTGILPDGSGRSVALPAWPGLRLWADAVNALGWDGTGRVLRPVREGMEKFLVSAERYRETPLPVGAVVVLTRHNRDAVEIEALQPGAAFEHLLQRTYRKRYARGLGREQEQFQALAALAGRVPVVRVAQPIMRLPLDALTDRVEACLQDGWPTRTEGRDASRWRAGGRRPWRKIAEGPAPQEAAAGPIVWLASYPRSGNTWLRALLTNYLEDGEDPAAIDALVGDPGLVLRRVFDDQLGLSSSDLTTEEILRLRARFHALLGAEWSYPSFVKVHDACLRTAGGGQLFPPSATRGAVYIVRNPLDVTVSNAHFWNWSITRSLTELCRPEATLSRPAGGIHGVLPQPLFTWSGHVASWLDQEEFPVHVVRYEDLLADPEAAFGAVLRFAGVEPESGRLARAVERADFKRLRAQEERSGFREKPPTAPAFFRSGRVGAWRGVLSREQVRVLVGAHGPLMQRFGYLGEATAFLSSPA